MHRIIVIALALTPAAVACGGTDTSSDSPDTTAAATAAATTAATGAVTVPVTTVTPPAETGEVDPADRFPDVIDAEATRADDGTWSFAVTMSSPYDTPERYADGWRVVGPGGEVFGVHQLAHDHANEQPFTRTQRGVVIPDDVSEVVIEGRDQQFGFGGATVTVTLPN